MRLQGHAQREDGSHPQKPAKTKARGGRQVGFAPGPLADKYRTHDGHPDHEGIVARPKRSLGLSWGHDLTPSSISDLEEQLGEECRPSLDRLKRRVGLLPVRKRPKEFLTWMLDVEEDEGEGDKPKQPKSKPRKRKQPEETAGPAAAAAAAAPGGATFGNGAAAVAAAAVEAAAEPEPGEKANGVGGGKRRGAKQQQLAGAGTGAGAGEGEGEGEVGSSTAASAARARQAMGGRKPRQRGGPAGRLIPPINRISAGLQWQKPPGAIPALRAPADGGSLGAALTAAGLPAITVTFNRRAGTRQQALLGGGGGGSNSDGEVAADGEAAPDSGADAEALALGGPSPMLVGAAAAATAAVAAAGAGAATEPRKKSRRLGSVADPLGSALGRGLRRGGTMH